MAAYVFLRWVLVLIYSSQIRHFREIMQLPMLKKFPFWWFSHSVVCCRAYAYTFAYTDARCKTQEFLVTVSWLHSVNTQPQRKICALCVLSCVNTADCENTNKNLNFLTWPIVFYLSSSLKELDKLTEKTNDQLQVKLQKIQNSLKDILHSSSPPKVSPSPRTSNLSMIGMFRKDTGHFW